MKDDFKAKQDKIIAIIKTVPSGNVASYGQVASIAGIVRGHRLVAAALRASTIPNLPWYRILRSDGRCGMAEGSEGYIEQFAILKTEGVLAKKGRVDMKRYQWAPNMDFLLFRPIDL
ncbi:MAG: methylated-DNA-protein-cysteine methyltransferase-like protein [Enterobacterales bacterium]|jgi:methylated-DNA-protein-cysteine methyltransferase-like protein